MEETVASSEEMSATTQEIERTVKTIAEKFQEGAKEASMEEVLNTIDAVAEAASEGAGGTTEIVNKVSMVNEKSNDVLAETFKSRENVTNLKDEISKFKI